MDIGVLHQRLVSLVLVIQHLGETQVAQILQFLDFEVKESRWNSSMVGSLLHRINEQQLEYLLYDCGDLPCDDPAGQEFIESLSPTERSSFSYLYHVYLLQDLMQNRFNSTQLMIVCEIIPSSPKPELQFQLLQIMQQLLAQVLPEQLAEMTSEGGVHLEERLRHLLSDLDPRFALVCDGVRRLMSSLPEDVQVIQQQLPELLPLQLVQLLRISKIDPFDVLQLQQWLSPDVKQGARGLQAFLEDPMEEEMTLQLRIVEQPPEKSVYKRNLKPNPRVMVVGEGPDNDEKLVIVPLLCRCDTQEILEDKLVGNTPVVVTGGSMAVFKRLKLLCTTRQCDGSLLSIRFELRRLGPDQQPGELVTFVHSNPIAVVSHTTQMNEPSVHLASVIETVPGSGPVYGGTRVAVIGHNFLQCDKTCVRFGDSVVGGAVFGEGTIVCTTPQRMVPEKVEVRVTNDGASWSDSHAVFEYVDDGTGLGSMIAVGEPAGQHHQFQDYTAEMFDQFTSSPSMTYQSASTGDAFGNSLLHHVARMDHQAVAPRAIQRIMRLKPQLSADIQNLRGETPLHVACRSGAAAAAKALLEHGASPNARDMLFATPLHAAAAAGDVELVQLLLKHGAVPLVADEDGDTALHWAIREGELSSVEALLAVRPAAQFLAARQNEDGESALHLAVATSASPDVVEALLEAQSSLECRDTDGNTALALAVERRAMDLVQRFMEVLAERGVDKMESEEAPAKKLALPCSQGVAGGDALAAMLKGGFGGDAARSKLSGSGGLRGSLDFSPLLDGFGEFHAGAPSIGGRNTLTSLHTPLFTA